MIVINFCYWRSKRRLRYIKIYASITLLLAILSCSAIYLYKNQIQKINRELAADIWEIQNVVDKFTALKKRHIDLQSKHTLLQKSYESIAVIFKVHNALQRSKPDSIVITMLEHLVERELVVRALAENLQQVSDFVTALSQQQEFQSVRITNIVGADNSELKEAVLKVTLVDE